MAGHTERQTLETAGGQSWTDLPIWRKLVLLACLVAVFYLGGNGYQHTKIYMFSPKAPVQAKGQIYPVQVMHGSDRYVTFEDRQAFYNSEGKATLICIPFIIGFLTLATFRNTQRSA